VNNQQMKDALDSAALALVERTGAQPYLPLKLMLQSNGKWLVGSAYLDVQMKQRVDGDQCDTPEEAFASVMKAIAALPSPEEAVTREYLTRVASAVDYATEHSIDEEYVAPLRGVSMAMTDNLLTKDAAE